MSHQLIDGVERSRARPTALNIPGNHEKVLIGPGDFVKLGFILSRPVGNFTAEKMWVEVVSVVRNVIIGTLANNPKVLEGLRHGDLVRAELRHVLSIRPSHKRILH